MASHTLSSFAGDVQSPNNQKNLRKISLRNPLRCTGGRDSGETRPRTDDR